MLNDEQIAAVRASLAGVTPGPWTVNGHGVCVRPNEWHWIHYYPPNSPRYDQDSILIDAAFIAASRTTVPLMLTELDRLYAALRAAAADKHCDDAVRDFAVGLLEGEL